MGVEGETGTGDVFEAIAVSVANGDGWLLDSFETLAPGTAGVVDIDFARHGANAWVVGPDEFGRWWECRVQLERALSGSWHAGERSSGSWDGWAEPAARRPPREWPGWGPVLGLTFESGFGGPPHHAFSALRGVAASDVVAIEFGFGTALRRRAVDSPTGGFIVTVPAHVVDQSPTMHAVLIDGSVLDLNC